jgi:hypothetical protein
MNRPVALPVLLIATLLAACADLAGPRVGPPAALVRVMGDDQTGAAGTALSTPVTVRVNDAQGQPVSGVVVTFTVQAGGGSVAPGQAQTGADGQAQTVWTLGREAGSEQRLEASFLRETGAPAMLHFRATAVAGPPVTVVKLEGDNQHGGTGMPLTDSLAVRVADQFGNGVPGITVTWTATAGSVSPATRTTNAQGIARTLWTLGISAGTVQVQAIAGALAPVTFTAIAQPLPAIMSITPGLLLPGGSMVITGINFPADPAASALMVAGVNVPIASATTTELRATLPATGFGCLPTGNVTVRLTAAGAVATRLHPGRFAPQRALAAGQLLASSAADGLGCVDLPQDGRRYLIAVTNTAGSFASNIGFRLNTIGAQGAQAAPPRPAPAAALLPAAPAAPATPPALHARIERHAAHEHNHARILQGNLELIDRLRSEPAHRAALRVRAAAAPLGTVPPPNVGDTLTMRVPRIGTGAVGVDLCRQFDEVRARVAFVGNRSIVLEDVSNPVTNVMDSFYRQLGQEFDARQYDIVRNNFDDPLRLNATLTRHGRILMLFTRRVDGSRVAGFVFGGDFFDRSLCPASNMAEVFYGWAPETPSTEFGGNSVGTWWWDIRTVAIHEAKHIASFASRIARDAPMEELWLEEATAVMAEELWAREVFGYRKNENVDYATSVGCEIRGAWNRSPCVGRPSAMYMAFMWLAGWMNSPFERSPVGRTDPADASFYGSGWLLLRHTIENAGRPEQTFLRELTQANAVGATNLSQRAGGRPFADLVSDFAVAAALDDRPDVSLPPALQIRSWNLRSIYAGLHREQPRLMPTAFPLAVTSLAFIASTNNVAGVRGGGTSYFELSGSPAPLALEFRGAGGGAMPAGLRIQIFRIE